MSEITVNEATGQWELDAQTYDPKPMGKLKLGDKVYPIYSFLDISVFDSIKVVNIGKEIDAADTFEARQNRSADQILILNAGPIDLVTGKPKHDNLLTREQLLKLPVTLLIELTLAATRIARVPLKPGLASDVPSATSSPAPGISTPDSQSES